MDKFKASIIYYSINLSLGEHCSDVPADTKRRRFSS